jgi:predicted NAD/FAD-binding protein
LTLLLVSQIVFNPPTYPNFLRFLKLHPAIEIIKTQMTFSVSRDGGAFEWAGDGLRSVFCQPKRVFDLGMWRMLFDIMRFNACAVRVLADENDDLSIGEYLRREGYSSQFRDDYLIVCLNFSFPYAMSLIIFDRALVAHDGCGVEYPARRMHHRFPG